MFENDKLIARLQTVLIDIDEQRKSSLRKIRPIERLMQLTFFGGLLLIIRLSADSMSNILFDDQQANPVATGYFFWFAITLIAFSIVHGKHLKKLKQRIASDMMPKIMPEYGDDFSYELDPEIPAEEIKASRLFHDFIEHFSEDLVTGQVNGNPVRFFELSLFVPSKRKNSTNTHKSFGGIFYETTLGISFPTSMWLMGVHKLKKKPEMDDMESFKLRNDELKDYLVFSEDPKKSKAVLVPFVQTKIAELNKKLSDRHIFNPSMGHVNYHFDGNKVQLSFPVYDVFMEPKLSQSILKSSFLNKQLEIIDTIINISKDLTLDNTTGS